MRVAVLNRGDAAMRFLRTAGELRDGDGPALEVVAVHTDPDRDAPFVRLADDAISLGPALRAGAGGVARPAYCDPELVLDHLRRAGVDAVWPGWGFLSEDPDFVDLLDEAGITFIGPPAAAMRALGDKVRAKQLAETCGVPLAPWAPIDRDAAPSAWAEAADGVGYPLMVKAANGGGGRGIRRVATEAELAGAVRAVRAEAEAAFGPGEVFLERCIEAARHVEVQFVVGVDGRAETLGVRDCSIQRRHQKLVEETPSPVLSPIEEEQLTASTARLAELAGYRGVGTAEFLYTPADRLASFCEVNARLQVEHTITEVVWGVDLVRTQLDIAFGRAHQRSAGPRGCAMQARVVAEDVARGFAPAPGRVLVHRPAAGPHVRVDAGVRAGSVIPSEFDSMIAKVVGWGPTRERAMSTLSRALREYEVLVEDGATNRGLLLDLLARDELRDATATTGWLETVGDLGAPARARDASTVALCVAAVELVRAARRTEVDEFFRSARSGVPQPPRSATRPVQVELGLGAAVHRVAVRQRGASRWLVGPPGREVDLVVEPLDDHAVVVHLGGRSVRVLVQRGAHGVTVDVEGRLHQVRLSDSGVIRAPGPALVVELAVEPGDRVRPGQRVGTLEAMKTEAPLLAERAGVVERVLVPVGTHVAAGEAVVVLRADDAETEAAGADRGGAVDSEDHWPASRAGGGVEEEVLDVLDALLTGHEVSDEEVDGAVEGLDELASGHGVQDGGWPALVERLGTFAAVEALFERNLLLLDDHSAAISAEAAFHELCRTVGEGAARPMPELEPLLGRALGASHGVALCEHGHSPDDELRLQLWRRYATRDRGPDRERLLLAALRGVISLSRAGVVDPAAVAAHLDEVERVSAGAASTVAGAAALARSELGSAGRRLGSVDVSTVDPAAFPGLDRYRAWDLVVLDGVATDAGRAIVVRAGDPVGSDRRTVLAVDFTGARGALGDLDEAELRPFGELFDAGAALLGQQRSVASGPAGRDWWAAAHVVLHGVHASGPGELLALSTRFEPATRGLALQDVTVALVPDDRSGASTEYSLRRRGHARMEVHPSDPAAARPRNELDRRALTARRLGVVDPWELIDLLCGRVHPDEVPHPSLREGSFVEHDLDATGRALVPVDRPPAEHECSVIVGVVANPMPGRSEWAERVLVAGDPLRSMGSLGEPECRRIVAALDLADERGIPVEWVSISSGARIAWDSGTENLDWTAAVLRRIVELTNAGGEIDVIVAGTNVGAQSYWNAEATMLMHTRGILVMTPRASMVLTGRRALELSGSVGAQDEVGIGGHERIMGPNGQSQYRADDLADAYAILMEHHALTHPGGGRTASSGERRAPVLATSDPVDRDVCVEPYKGGDEGFTTVGELFDPAVNPGRKRPFSIRAVMDAVADRDGPRLERWRTMADADGAVVWETRLGGHPVSLIGIESRPRPRRDAPPVDGPSEWAGGTLYPAASKKVARALRAASGNRAAVVLANLSGFDGSPESLRRLQLEYGAEIARAVVDFHGPIVFVVIGRYHGGAYVVFSKQLNPQLTALAVEGSYASVIGGAPAAAVVLTKDVRELAAQDPEVQRAAARLERAAGAEERLRSLEALDQARTDATARARAEVAQRFDSVHTVERAVQVGSLDRVIPASRLRPEIVAALTRSVRQDSGCALNSAERNGEWTQEEG